MKCEISSTGTLIIIPESSTEIFAILTWKNDSIINKIDDMVRMEDTYYRGSRIKIGEIE